MTALDTIKQAVLGVPMDPDKQPSRVGVVQAFAEMQSQLEGAQAGALVFDTFANLPTGAVPSANIMAWVMTGTQAGIYQNTGTASVPIWTWRGSIPQFLVTGINVGEGTADAIQITTDIPFPSEDGRALLLIPILGNNTISPPTVSINGGSPLPIVTNSGNNVVVSGVTAGMYIAGFVSDGKFRLLSDQASAAIVAAAEGWANIAQAAADNVLSFATKAAASVAVINSSIHSVSLKGNVFEGDGLGGLYIDVNNGSSDNFISADNRTWYRDRSEKRDYNIALTVGPGGTYSTLNAAIEAASIIGIPRYKFNGLNVNIILKAGFVMAEQIFVRRRDLGFITITSEDAVVNITASSITQVLTAEDLTTPVFGGSHNAVLPIIGCLFSYGSSVSARDGVAVHYGSKVGFLPGSGIRYCRRGIQVLYNSEAYCYMPGLTQGGAGTGAGTVTGVRFDYASNRALHVGYNSRAGLARSNFSNGTSTAEVVYIIWGSNADLYQSQIKDNAGTAIYCRDGSFCNARETQVARSRRGYHALHNSRINARSKEGSDANPWIGDSAKDCVEYGILASYNSHVDAAVVDVSGCLNRGVHASNGSSINFYQGVAKNVGSIAVSAYDGSMISAFNVDASGSQVGFTADSGSTISCQTAIANNCTQFGYIAMQGSTIAADSSSANKCTLGGYWANEASNIQARNSSASGISGTLMPFGFQADRSSNMNVRGSTANFCVASFRAQEGSDMNAQNTTATSSTVGYTWSTGSKMNLGSTTASTSSTVNTISAAGIGFK